MADNVAITAGSGTTIATDDVGGFHYQRVKPAFGADGSATDVSTTDPLPVKDRLASRVIRNFILDTWTAAPVADALQSVVQWYNNAAVGATTQPAVVPAGKILRLTGGQIEMKALATFGSALVRIRCNTAGLVVIGSPIAGTFGAGGRAGATTVSATGHSAQAEFTFGELGLEFPAASGIGFSMAGYGPAGALQLQGVTRFVIYGYEYTA